MLSLWPGWSADWLLYHKANFDGASRVISIHPEVSSLDVKRDLYSAWKEWVCLRDNSKFPAAFRSVGGDPVGVGQFAGDMYFLLNGWKLYVDHAIDINGVLYSEDGSSPYQTADNTHVVRSTVSNLALAVGQDTLNQLLGELPAGVPPIEPKVAEALAMIYSALRNKVLSQPDGVTYHRSDGSPSYKQPVTTIPGVSVTRDAPESV